MRSVFSLALAALCFGLGCSAYKPGSFSHHGRAFAGERRTVGCLDVGVEAVNDPGAAGPAVGYTFANRCDAAVTVDLGAVRAIGRYGDGSRAPLVPYDPDREIRPGVLDARFSGREVIEYHPAYGEPLPDAVCVDLSGLDPGAPAAVAEVCLAGPRLAAREESP